MSSTEGALPVGQPGPTAGNSWTGIQANILSSRYLMAYIALPKNHTVICGKKKFHLLLINYIHIKVITGYTLTFHSSRPVYIDVKNIVFVIQTYEGGSVA